MLTQTFFPLAMSDLLLSLLAFMVILSPLVLLHELGHYWVARFFGVQVESFSVGFGPELLGWTDRAGTRWRFSAIPLGGYVQLLGETCSDLPSSSEKPVDPSKTFAGKAPWKRILIAFAGPLTNYLVAFGLLLAVFTSVGKVDYQPIVGTVMSESIAEQKDIHVGDRLVSVQGKAVNTFGDFLSVLRKTPTIESLKILLQRDGVWVPIEMATEKMGMWSGNVGIRPDSAHKIVIPLSSKQAFEQTLSIINPLPMLRSLSISQMGGPISIAHQAGQIWKEGWPSFFLFMGMISIGLGFFNLLPIPLLDGGMVCLCVVEKLMGRPLSARMQQTISFLVLVGLGSLFLFLSWNDLKKIAVVAIFMKKIGL